MQPDYLYKAKIVKVIDGDTVDAVLDLGFYMSAKLRLRLNGINTPELTSQDVREASNARQAKMILASLVESKDVLLKTYKADKYGRWLADIILDDGLNVNNYLLESNLAVPYK